MCLKFGRKRLSVYFATFIIISNNASMIINYYFQHPKGRRIYFNMQQRKFPKKKNKIKPGTYKKSKYDYFVTKKSIFIFYTIYKNFHNSYL